MNVNHEKVEKILRDEEERNRMINTYCWGGDTIELYKGFEIQKIEHGYRITKINSKDKHTHLSSKSACYNAINYVLSRKIPKRTGNYYLTSLARLSDDEIYISKINQLIDTRLKKGKKLNYYNPIKKNVKHKI